VVPRRLPGQEDGSNRTRIGVNIFAPKAHAFESDTAHPAIDFERERKLEHQPGPLFLAFVLLSLAAILAD